MGTRSIRYCDISGTEEDVEAHVINVDQMRVEIDLAGLEYRKLLKLLQPYIDAGMLEASAPELPGATASTTGRRQRHRTGTDLSKDEREQLRPPYIDAGMLEASAPELPGATVSTTGRKQRHRTGTDLSKDEREQLRQWAEQNGISVAANNRFKLSLVQQWRNETAETD